MYYFKQNIFFLFFLFNFFHQIDKVLISIRNIKKKLKNLTDPKHLTHIHYVGHSTEWVPFACCKSSK